MITLLAHVFMEKMYGILIGAIRILSGGEVTEDNIETNLPKLKDFYIKSGYMNNTPADLFETS